MILRAKWVVDRNLDLVHCGSVVLPGDQREIDFGDSILMPGLVNAHTHFDYTNMRGAISDASKGFASWIGEINALKRGWTLDHFISSVENGIEESLAFGTTMAANWYCRPETIPLIKDTLLRILWLSELIEFREKKMDLNGDEPMAAIKKRASHWSFGLAPHAPYTCCPEVVRSSAEWCDSQNVPWSIHVAESHEEFEMFSAAKGRMYELFNTLGRSMVDCGNSTPLKTIATSLEGLKNNISSFPILLVHGNTFSTEDFSILEQMNRRFKISIIHCPRSHAYFHHPQFSFDRLRKLGINVCLGTDSLASNHNLSMFEEMKQMACVEPGANPKDILEMSTRGAASALGVKDEWYQWQDWIVLPLNPSKNEVFEAIVNFTSKPTFIMIQNQVVVS